MRPTPTTAGDWHCALIDHLTHELVVHTRMQPMQVVVVACAASDGRASLSVRPDGTPEAEARWRPHVSMRLFFADRSVGCRTCQMPVAR
ncbi:hypothetical protein [Streptomyces sp. NPDC002467]|uniref:hypothetical protein n=1 Tax=Streptomyces sp. NPDC002467 TaxID=3364647 RepID=UPI0036899538